jgi:hypothetical protein
MKIVAGILLIVASIFLAGQAYEDTHELPKLEPGHADFGLCAAGLMWMALVLMRL